MGAGRRGGPFCTFVALIDPRTYLAGCCGFGGGPVGIYRTADEGATWTRVSEAGGGTHALRAKDGSIYWPGPGGVTRGSSDGLTWSAPTGGQAIRTLPIIELPVGLLAALAGQ